LILLIYACALGYALGASVNCDGQIQKYQQCENTIRDNRQAEMKSKMDSAKPAMEKCFKDNGCQVPEQEQHQPKNNNGKNQQCHQDLNASLKGKVQECIRKTSPGFNFPAENHKQDEHEGGMRMKGGKKAFETACGGSADKVKAVQACIKQNGHGNTLSEQQRKDRFEKNCQEKAKCETDLGGCRAQLDGLKKAICQCNQEVRTEANLNAARAATPSCAGQEAGKGGKKKGNEQRSCDGGQKKDWCKEGYEAWKANQAAEHKPKGGH